MVYHCGESQVQGDEAAEYGWPAHEHDRLAAIATAKLIFDLIFSRVDTLDIQYQALRALTMTAHPWLSVHSAFSLHPRALLPSHVRCERPMAKNRASEAIER
uniref:Uncharacterized protein n=1 Tax=Lotharella globosa TaxID=91324 RepID=A0A7S3Z0V3_9EUKA